MTAAFHSLQSNDGLIWHFWNIWNLVQFQFNGHFMGVATWIAFNWIFDSLQGLHELGKGPFQNRIPRHCSGVCVVFKLKISWQILDLHRAFCDYFERYFLNLLIPSPSADSGKRHQTVKET